MYLNIVSMHAPRSSYAPLNLGLGEPSTIMNIPPEVKFYLEPAEPHISITNFINQQTHTSTDTDMGLLKAY